MNEIPLDLWEPRLIAGGRLDRAEALRLADATDLTSLTGAAARLRDVGYGDVVTVSRKVFIPLTQLCRDVCHYCTFAHPPRPGQRAFLTPDEVIDIARAGARVGCDEALFTLGDKPEQRYRVAREELAELGYETTLKYLEAMARLVLTETGLLPHLNAGVMSEQDCRALRAVSVSQGLMLETASDRLSARGGPHFGSPDKLPARRLASIADAGRAAVPFTSGILIGIGETRGERIDALLALRDLHDAYGHIQEIIIQNFRAKPSTKMAAAAEPSLDEHRWTIAVARLIFGPRMSIQSPPNLRRGELPALIAAGINDWGGVSPVTPDHVNPEAPWPELTALATESSRAGKTLAPRLAIYPSYLAQPARWIDPAVLPATLERADGQGFAHETSWRAGLSAPQEPPHDLAPALPAKGSELARVIDKGVAGHTLSVEEIVTLFSTRGPAERAVRSTADQLRREVVGDTVTYVVTRNINYTNVCSYRCQFCAFSKGKLAAQLRGRPYDLDLAEVKRRTVEAWERGATEVCLQGGIHPDYTGDTYASIAGAVKEAVPGIHVHAFSPLEINHGARTLGMPVEHFLQRLKVAGLGSLPGTAAEILDDEVRRTLCAEKLSTAEWLETMRKAHRVGLRTTATIMFGHIERYQDWANHLLRIRELQLETGGFTEFVPLPFIHMEAPIYLRGGARQGPSYREAVLMHAVSRLALAGAITNIQTSWVKMGENGVRAALLSGANDLGGTLMNESISRAAGTTHGQEMPPQRMEEIIGSIGRQPRQRTTLYRDANPEQTARSFDPVDLLPVVQLPAGKYARVGSAAARRRDVEEHASAHGQAQDG